MSDTSKIVSVLPKNKKNNPKISVIIPCYNQAPYIAECLDSVLAQTFQDFEVIIVDDGSSDNSLTIIQKYHKEHPDKIYFISQNNQGVIAARNNAIFHATGEFIFPLDGDDLITPDCLEKLIKHITKKADIITFRVQFFGKKTTEAILNFPNKYNMTRDNCLVNAALFKKSDFEKTGGYDPAFQLGLEDYDLWCNFLYRHNKTFYRIPEILFFYRLKNEDESRNLQYVHEHKNLTRLLYKKYPKMHFYKKLTYIIKYMKFIKKIRSFLFRKENNRIKICKIPIKKIKNYDMVISVGANYRVTEVLTSESSKKFTGPFDFAEGIAIENVLKIIHNKFQNYFNYEDFKLINKNKATDNYTYKNNRTGMIYHYDFTSENLDKINDRYSADIDLLFVQNNQNINFKKYNPLKNISNHIFYSEYLYLNFPKEIAKTKEMLKTYLGEIL